MERNTSIKIFFQRYLDESGIVGQTPSVKTLKERNNREKEHTVIRGG